MTAPVPRSDRLRGRTALVTGAASGIGAAIARHFVLAGAEVVLLDLSPAVHEEARRIGAVGAVTADVSDEARVAGAVAEAGRMLGRIDVLVNSHGILTEAPVAEMTLATWQRTIDVDLTSVFLLTRAVLPGMLERRDGRIITVASQLGQKGGVGLAHYAAAKAGVIAFTKSLALEVSASNVLANVIAPGPISTPLVDAISEDWKDAKRRELPLGRFGTVDEVAPTAVLLAADPDGNLFVGQTLGPNSGDVMP
ncbi:SDR family NAD(P)-dependent oxidoreductase [Clavibacter michiganensis subsp. michiganensis]|uniref:SDR family oxidoreductase n=1 Tax=Clavibacter michiganensis TaxID=28447 RepID=UPI000B715E1E|nr:SDR family oxidoreductase [Clavibacter michiganensis]MDO4141653.1 SDR family oxidoreductase [Clavibacter michiganensis]MWJ19524.1 SDR family NAD(P)-dependent oxidoreductase [Clavibacter michiganensis subsp. michiganensis]OUD99416.1 3-oxoacyl-[acyl-carrier-protein] reductase FabG [Clavibacter michiganensis subsp. michiganensis]OUE06188.1 3-oxoacyl-[acyl-carrier-protein] reductase FabG [Clavibacter michiganensis subsp. michiganensis]